MILPTLSEIEALHHKYAPTRAVFELVFTHCQIVSDVAEQLIDSHALRVNRELVRAGCLLHDVGVYPLFDKHGIERSDLHYITHGIRGESILKAEGFPEAIWRFASHHTGVGLSEQDITLQKLPLPVQAYEAETAEEALIMYADKFHSKTTPPYFNSYEWYDQYVRKFGADKAEKFHELAETFGHPDLAPLITKYGHQLRTS